MIKQNQIPFIDLETQYNELRQSIHSRIDAVLSHGQYVMGPEVLELEQTLASFVGVDHCIGASSGSDTLLIAMMALNIGPGDEVITTPFTFIATGEMIALLGAKPVFVDVDIKTCNIDAAKIEAAITPKTKAILPVSLFGQCADMDSINGIALEHGLVVIEDAAQSFGATYKKRSSCSLSTVGSTSFFPSKPLGGYGDGGALFTNDAELARKMREIRSHGQERRYLHTRIGLNGRLDTLQAAVLLAKFERFELEVSKRHAVAQRYTDFLNSERVNLRTPFVESYNTSVFAQYTIFTPLRDEVCRDLKERGIPTAIHYPTPLHRQPAFSYLGYQGGDFPCAEQLASTALSIPMGPDLTEEHQMLIIESLLAALSK